MSKLSVHYNNSGNKQGFNEFLQVAKPSVIYSLNGNIKSSIEQFSPETKIIYRRQTDTFNRLPNDFFVSDPVQSATNWLIVTKDSSDQQRTQLQNWLLNPADWYDPLNEPVIDISNPDDPNQVAEAIRRAKWLNTWELTALEITHNHGLKLVLFSFGTESGTLDARVWNELIPCITKGKEYGAIISLHAYGIDGELSNRPQAYKQHINIYNLLPSNLHLPVVYTECGAGNGYNTGLCGQAYVNDLGLVDEYWTTDSLVLGGCSFQLGGNESNMVDVLGIYAEYISQHPNEEDMKLNIVVTENLIPQDTTTEELDYVQTIALKQDILWSADVAKYLVQNSLPGSKVVVWNPERWSDNIIAYLNCETEIKYFGNVVPFKLSNPVPSIPFRVTDLFNAPRNYANGKHEGLDLDAYNDNEWQRVLIVACADGVVEKVNNIYTANSYGRYVIVDHQNGYKTWYCHLSRTLVTEGQAINKGQSLGISGSTGTTAIHLHLNLQHIGHGLNGYYIPDVVDPLPYFDIETPPVVSTAKSGLHMAARGGDQSLDDWQAFDTAKLNSIKFMSNHALNDVISGKSKVGAENVYFRMYADPNDSGVMSSGTNFFNVHRGWFDQLYPLGIINWEVHNEPNLISEGLGTYWNNALQFSIWFRQVANLIRTNYPNAKIIYPGLSPQSNVPEWKLEIQKLINEGLVDKIGAHSYWQTPGAESWGMLNLDGGQFYQTFLNMGKSVVITECSNNSQTLDKTSKGNQYVQYIKTIKSGVEAVLFFVSSTSNSAYDAESWINSPIPQIVGAR